MNARTVVALLLLGGLVVGMVVLSSSDDTAPRTDDVPEVSIAAGGPAAHASLRTPTFGSPTTCLPCHREVYDEWNASMHAVAFTDPQVRAPGQANNFQKTECLPCHAPAPLFDQGVREGERVVARVERRADGVDCISCHQTPEGMAASRPGLTGACQPVYREEVSTHFMCAACHDQHLTHQEWLASPAFERGDDCMSCHMERVQRNHPEVGAPRVGRSHRFLGGRDKEFALPGIGLTHSIDDESGMLVVSVTNEFEGHNLITDTRNRALDLVVTLFDGRGRPVPMAADAEIVDEQTEGTARLRLRNPYRSSGKPSTLLPPGESRRLVVPIGEARRATVALHYKLEPFIPDREAHWSHVVDVDLP